MKPNYVATKSAMAVISFWGIVSCILIIPIFVLIFKILAVKQFRIEFYDDKIITYKGLLNKTKKQSVFMGVNETSVNQTLMGRIFKYGNVSVDCVGKWDIDTNYIKNPHELEEYLLTKIVQAPKTTQYVQI